MKVYVTHPTNYDYRAELYAPLKEQFATEHELFLPHEDHADGAESRDIVTASDVVLAEVSLPSTGQGIELGWASAAGVPIICFYRHGATPSGALRFITSKFLEYTSSDDMLAKLRHELDRQTDNR